VSNDQFDYLVIGAGMAGASLAARLAPHATVGLLEMETQPGYHSTGRSAASWIENYGNDTIVRLNRASFNFLASPPEEFPCDGVLTKRGVLWVARPGSESSLAEMYSDDVVELDEAAALQKVPALKAGGIAGFGFEDQAYDIDVATLHQAHLKTFKANGGLLVCDAKVASLVRVDGEWRVTTAAGRKLSAGVVVNAAGAWADEVAKLAGVKPVGLQPLRRSAAMIPVPESFEVREWPFVVEVEEAFYFRPDGGQLMLSPADTTPVEPHDAWADDLAIAQAADVFAQVMQFEVSRVTHTWAGLRTFAPDSTPVVGMDETPGFFWFAGQGGYGIQTSPAMASLGMSLLLDKPLESELQKQKFDIAAVAPGRLR